MPDFPGFSELFRVARDEILSRQARLSRDAVEREGMDANILIAGACAAADEVMGQLTTLAASLFLDSATGPALDRLVLDRYGLVKKPAAAAQARLRKIVERLETAVDAAAGASARARALEDRLAKSESERAALAAKLDSLIESRAVAKVTAREISGRLDRAVGEVRAALGR